MGEEFQSPIPAGFKPGPTSTYNQSANSTTTTVVYAAVNVGALTLLTDAITAIGTLQTALNNQGFLLNNVITNLKNQGLAL